MLAEQHMRMTAPGHHLVDYAMLVLGSAGRDESLLAADQDHAIVYADVSADRSEPTQSWFETLGGHVSDYLNLAGIPYCQGRRHVKTSRLVQTNGWLAQGRQQLGAQSQP